MLHPPVTGTTHIVSVSPQVALPGATVVYIKGYCFGDTQGTGSIKLNGEKMTDIVFWTDAEIAFRPLLDATSGTLQVTSSSYGHDDTTTEANCPTPPPDYVGIYCGNDKINAAFSIKTVNTPGPAYSPPNMIGTESAPEYVQGTWSYDDGDETMTLTLNQETENTTNHTWPITGSEVDNIWGQYNNVSGTLDQYGDLALCLAFGNQEPNGVQWLVLGSGDVTSQGLNYGITCTPGTPPVPTQNFVHFGMSAKEGPYYYEIVPPLFKSATDLPLAESVVSNGWVVGSPTLGDWGRTLPLVNGFVGFAGRFVYEQSGGAPTDGCYYPNGNPPDPQPEQTATTLTGGGWYVNSSGGWGDDKIGMPSQWDTDYQNHYGPLGQTCEITTPRIFILTLARGQNVTSPTRRCRLRSRQRI